MAYFTPTYPTSAGRHPRIWIHDTRGVTPAELRTRVEGPLASQWATMLAWCAGRLGTAPATWLASYEPEALASMCLPYVLYPTNTTYQAYADKAIEVATYAAQSYPDSGRTRDRLVLMGMAIVYDWLYSRLSVSQRSLIRGSSTSGSRLSLVQRIYAHKDVRVDANLSEFMWGHSSEWCNIALFGLLAILEDSTSGTENATWQSWCQGSLDQLYDGTNVGNSGAIHKYFGDDDGGSFKGSGFYSYFVRTEEYYIRLVPALLSAINVDLWTAFPWWTKTMDWQIWHYRGDQTLGHVQNEGYRFGRVHTWTQVHALQVANRTDDTRARNCMWFANEIDAVDDVYRIWGYYHIHNIFWRPTSRTPTAPVANPQMKVFTNQKKVVIRDGFDQTATSLTISGQRYTGGHSRRDMGHVEVTTEGTPLLVSHGHYNGNQTVTYFDPAITTHASGTEYVPTGHRFSYYAQSLAHNCVRIHDANEPDENRLESSQFQFGSDTYFGIKYALPIGDMISNTGGQLWPKDITGNRYQPDDLAHFLSVAKWNYESFAITPIETDRYCYVVINCQPAYYAPKCSRYKRHLLWIKKGQLTSTYQKPVILIWDDITAHSEAESGYGTRTKVQQWGMNFAPTGTAANILVASGGARCWIKTLAPTVTHQIVYGFRDTITSPEFVPAKTTPYDDSTLGAVRVELSPTTGATEPGFFTAILPTAASTLESQLPALTLFSDATHIGVTIVALDLQIKIARGDTHAVVWGTTAPPIDPPSPPVPPTGLGATAGNGTVALAWVANVETDLDHYNVYRRTKVGASYLAWAKIAESLTNSYTDNAVTNGTTYQYAVTAENEIGLESAYSGLSLDTTPEDPPPPPPPPPDPSGPSYNNLQRSIGMHPCLTIPPAPDGTPALGDQLQWLWVYANLDPPELVVTSNEDGADMDVSGTGIDGTTIDAATAVDGNPIEVDAATGIDGQEIST